MMTFGFDVDGTLTAHPQSLGVIMTGLRSQGHRVLVITGCLEASPTSPHQREQQLAVLPHPIENHVHYDELFVVQAPTTDQVADGKGTLCRREGVAMMFEDTPSWIPRIRARAPGTACVLVCP